MDERESQRWWREQIERRLNQVGSSVKGNQDFQADRIIDVIEQIEELRRDLTAVKERQDKIATYVRENVSKRQTEKET